MLLNWYHWQLPEILRSLVHLSIDNEMPCFDPRDVLFVTNKWDTITSCDSDSDDEEDRQVEKTWKDLKSKIKKNWSEVKEENIFKMSLKHVHFFLLYKICMYFSQGSVSFQKLSLINFSTLFKLQCSKCKF